MFATQQESLTTDIALSAAAAEGVMSTREFWQWWDEQRAKDRATVREIPLGKLRGWEFESNTGNLVHVSRRFFSVAGVRVRSSASSTAYAQPMLFQPEVGVLGVAMSYIDGVLHCLVQAKHEPGNVNGVQLSPTVQATRSNYTRVHGGRPVPYLDIFVGRRAGRPIADVLQSEQGSWFYRKRNRNMVMLLAEPVAAQPTFCWLTVGQLRHLMRFPDLVDMDLRSVLACLPMEPREPLGEAGSAPSPLGAAVRASLHPSASVAHTTTELLSWLIDARLSADVSVELLDLARVPGWRREDAAIRHETGRHFDIMAASVRAPGREVTSWSQPLLRPCSLGISAFLARRVNGVVHLLMQARQEPGLVESVELGPTLQRDSIDYPGLDDIESPFLDRVLHAKPEDIWYDVVHSEEGGRFYHARTRYMVVEEHDELPVPAGYRWVAPWQIAELLKHPQYVNVQGRTLFAAVQSLW